MTYDSTLDTLKHRARVVHYIDVICEELRKRGAMHDESKLHEPEKSLFDERTPELKNLVYGTPEYAASEEAIRPAIEHHWANNRHHPEHWPTGISDMTLVDVIEMFCDWLASAERNKGGIRLDIACDKYTIEPMLENVIFNQFNDMAEAGQISRETLYGYGSTPWIDVIEVD